MCLQNLHLKDFAERQSAPGQKWGCLVMVILLLSRRLWRLGEESG